MVRTRKTPKASEGSSTWTHAMIVKLIRLYKQNEHLWNAYSPLFRLAKPRIMTWQQISKDLKVSVPAIASKIRSLRKVFRANWNKVQLTGTEENVKWQHYAPLKFLVKSFNAPGQQKRKENGKRHSSLKNPRITPEPVAALLNNENGNEPKSDTFLGFSSAKKTNAIPNIDRDKDDNSDCSIYVECSSREQKFPMPKIEICKTVFRSARYERLTQTNGDRIDRFFKSMADTVKAFPPRTVAEIKLNISNLIGQFELQLTSGVEVAVVNN